MVIMWRDDKRPRTAPESKDIIRPLAMRAHLDDTLARVLAKQAAGDVKGVQRALLAAVPRFLRLGGVETVREMDREVGHGGDR